MGWASVEPARPGIVAKNACRSASRGTLARHGPQRTLFPPAQPARTSTSAMCDRLANGRLCGLTPMVSRRLAPGRRPLTPDQQSGPSGCPPAPGDQTWQQHSPRLREVAAGVRQWLAAQLEAERRQREAAAAAERALPLIELAGIELNARAPASGAGSCVRRIWHTDTSQPALAFCTMHLQVQESIEQCPTLALLSLSSGASAPRLESRTRARSAAALQLRPLRIEVQGASAGRRSTRTALLIELSGPCIRAEGRLMRAR
jgi:hypothetical protein